jgi:hypothetical protein
MDVPDTWFWIRTVGAPREGDPRDGELHRMSSLPDHFDLEPWEHDSDGEVARYVPAASRPDVDEMGRSIWRYAFQRES